MVSLKISPLFSSDVFFQSQREKVLLLTISLNIQHEMRLLQWLHMITDVVCFWILKVTQHKQQ